MQTTCYFYPASFDLKLIQSTRQGDFTALKRGRNTLSSTEYKTALTTAKAFLGLTTNRFLKEFLLQINEQMCLMFSTKTVYHNCDNTQYEAYMKLDC